MNAHTRKYTQLVTVYSLVHFLVDFACAFFMFHSIAGTPYGYTCVLLYNFCAFAMQMPLGAIADKLNRNALVAAAGCILVGLAYALAAVPIAAVIVIGIGNAMFHIGGGIDVLNISEKKLNALGIFVSPGAFGIYFGTILGTGSGFPVAVMPIALIAAAGLVLLAYKSQKGTYPKNAEFSLAEAKSGHALIAVACLLLVVCLRSYVGLALNFSWKGIGHWGLALICAVGFGKTIGGIAADRLGTARTSIISLGICAVLFLFPNIPTAGVAAVLLSNVTMPITLWAMAKIFPNAKGFAFGLLTFGLFLGFLPIYLGYNLLSGVTLTVIAVISLGMLLVGLRRAKL